MKRNYIRLVKEMKNNEPVFDTFVTPAFIPFKMMYQAVDLMDEMQGDKVTEKQAFDMMLDMVVDIYNKQFSKEQLMDGLHAPDALTELQEQVAFVAEGRMSEERKKELAKMI
ncbi:hypothetical protein ERX37_05455 [Macrococcus hajekii]|uniref:Phage protein n=1 Tax=Macrococcus hajekii TaxID=198482 RepID=A0A4R6BP70_9STAP|nr:hypothetical protein [Macrococcus hajekii]TDM03532.1 hypothetical protein ERX37_05455 [Macrococcus hajekii]GGA99604.1 hypothetical protein GCM10007190_04580 [Macrococcus hajekii]